jgi:hypothetical protein
LSARDLPEDVRRFITQRIDSIEQLEILLLLRAKPDRSWSAREVSDELRTDMTSAAARLSAMAGEGLVKQTGDSEPRYTVALTQEASVLKQVAEVYATRRYSVIDLIFSKPSDKIRVFARAFRIKEEEDG